MMRSSPTTPVLSIVLGRLLYPVKVTVHFALMAVAAAAVAPLAASQVPLFATIESFLPQLAALGFAAGVLGLPFRPRAMALLGFAVCAWNLVQVWPYLPLPSALRAVPLLGAWTSGAVAADTTSPKLKVVSANLWYRNGAFDTAVAYLAGTDADVIGLIELTPQWTRALAPLYERYPYRIDCMDRVPPCEIMLLSRYPLLRSYAGSVDGHTPTIAWGEIQVAGRPITVAVTHLAWPLERATEKGGSTDDGALTLEQSQQVRNLVQYSAGLDSDLVLMGDFNSVPWSRAQATLRAGTGLKNDGPMLLTWPAWQPLWSRLPIDQVFVRGALDRVSFGKGPFIGSDHFPVEAEIALKAQ